MNRMLYILALTLTAFSVIFTTGCSGVSSEVRSRVDIYKPGELVEHKYGMDTIATDTTWDGIIHITGDILVEQGATLTIKPGTRVSFDVLEPKLEKEGGRNMFGLDSPYFPGAEIIVRGRIIAVGTADAPIEFRSTDINAKPGSWGAINLLGSNGNVLEFCRVYQAYNGVHNHASTAMIINNVFSGNGTALSFKKADFEHPCFMFIEHNTIVGNLSGISARNAIANIAFNDISDNVQYGILVREGVKASIQFNDITRNKTGIFLSNADPIKISDNNIYNNNEYNIGLAEDNKNNVDAAQNWWGTLDSRMIASKIYDRSADIELGVVNFTPFMGNKVTGITK